MGVSQSRPSNRIRDAEWVRFAAEDDILSLDATPPDQIVPSAAVEEKNDSDDDDDNYGGGCYCNYCCSYNHNDDECPLLNPSLAAADSKNANKGPTILSSQDASLMEGLIEDDIVRTSFLVSLSSDLLKQTESEKSPFSSVLTARVSLLDTLHQALMRSRNAARMSKEVPNPSEMTFVSLIQAQSGEEATNKSGLNSPNASLLLQMCVELLKSSMQISAENPICVKILDTLQQVLANPLPLSLCSNPETSEFASNVVDFLISVSSASEAAGANPSAQVKAMQKRAVMLLLHLILQMGSLLTALKTVKLLGLKTSSSESYLSEAEYRSFFSTFVRLKPSIGINPYLNSATPHYLGEWNWQFSNYSKNQSLVSAADRKGNRAISSGGGGGRGRFGRGRRGRGRAPRKARRAKTGNDEEDEQQTQAFNVAIATDGTFLFLHSSDYGLVRIGTGLNNTLRGHVYQHLIEFGKDESSNQLAYLAPYLYYRSDRTGQNVLKLDPVSLEQIEEINLTKTSGIHVNPDSPLIACHRYLYVVANYVPPALATPKEPFFSLQAVSTEVGPVVRKKPEFQILTLDPSNNFAVVHKARLNNPALKSEHADNEPSVALAKRNTETCNFCQRFHTLGNMFSSNFTSAWCSICFKRGYKPGENVRIRNADSATQTEFPSWYMPSISGQGPSPRFGHTAALVRGKKIQAEKEDDDEEDEEKTQPAATAVTAETEETEANLIWIFGGGSGRPLQYNGASCTVDMAYNDLFVFDADNASWHTLSDVRGEAPSS